jgi:hypothetical protein
MTIAHSTAERLDAIARELQGIAYDLHRKKKVPACNRVEGAATALLVASRDLSMEVDDMGGKAA